MGIRLDIVKKQGKDTDDGHAELRVQMTVDGKINADVIYCAKIVTINGKQVVEITTNKIR